MVYEFPMICDYYRVSSKTNFNYYFKQDKLTESEEQTGFYILSDIGIKLQKGSHEPSIHIDNLLETKYIHRLSLTQLRN